MYHKTGKITMHHLRDSAPARATLEAHLVGTCHVLLGCTVPGAGGWLCEIRAISTSAGIPWVLESLSLLPVLQHFCAQNVVALCVHARSHVWFALWFWAGPLSF